MLIDYRASKSEQAEAMRAIRTAVLFGAHSGASQLVQITSPNKRDGKTTVAANLAVAIAQSGRRTLLIDADLQSPRLHEVFALDGPAGLAAALAGDAQWTDVVRKSSVNGLDVLTCGSLPSNPSELLSSPRFRTLLDDVRQRYDHVLMDTAALLESSDPRVVAHRVDGVLLTIRINRRGRLEAERTLQVMGPLASKLIGVVVNNPDARRPPWASDPFAGRRLVGEAMGLGPEVPWLGRGNASRPASLAGGAWPAMGDDAGPAGVGELGRLEALLREKQLMRILRGLRIPFYGPTVARRYRSPSKRLRICHQPLFSNYVFLYGNAGQKRAALTSNCVSRWFEVPDGAQLTADLQRIRRLIETGRPLTPEARLAGGARVRVRSGIFAGFEGVVIRRENEVRLLIGVRFMNQGASVLLDDCQLERVA
jgi:capsular exopolysaccharide synthesis family protein